MKIEILLTSDINERCTGMTCFEASKYISDRIVREKPIQGILIVDGAITKFSFSPMSMDGDIFTSNDNHRTMCKHLIPIYVLNEMVLPLMA